MKKPCGKRPLSLLLTLAACLALAPAAWAADSITITDPVESTLLMKKGEERSVQAEASGPYAWESSDRTVVSVNNSTATITAIKPGTANIYAFLRSNTAVKSAPLAVTVSGIAVPDTYTLPANTTKDLATEAMKWCVGDADPYTLEFSSLDTDIVGMDDGFITGLRTGEAEVEIRYGFQSTSGTEIETLKVTVEKDPNTVINVSTTLATNDTLSFGSLSLPSQLDGSAVSYATGLYVPTDQGTLYYDYRSEAEPGAGVGQTQSYYRNPDPGQRALDKVTFVPKPTYPGGKVTITFTAVTEDYQNYSCEINLTVQGTSDDGASAGGISLDTEYGTAVQFDSLEFGTICREKLGVQLDYVIFSQPPERQGTLYTNYVSADSYGSLVDVHRQYSRRELDDVWFVPAPGYGNGIVTVYYTGFGTNGKSYSGQVFITVEQENQISTGGLSYNTSPGVAARFDAYDFDYYCYQILGEDGSQTLSAVRFESLPAESDGILYYDYQSSANPGVRAEVGTVYYYGSRAPRIDRLAFVPAEDFAGTLKLPFTGWTMDGTSFSGSVEINVRAGVTAGDIYYYCAPGRTVGFLSSDFTSLSRTLTDRTLDYIRLLGLPDTSEGSLYYGNSRISGTGASYTSININRLSFRAANSFSGLVNIRFEGRSTGGDTFSGIITIGDGRTGSNSTGSSTGGNSSSQSSVDVTARYSTRTEPIWFYSGDLARNGSSLSSIRFTSLPSSGAGYLYYQYSSPTRYGQQASTGTAYQASGGSLISDVAFVPRAGYSGTVTIPYTGTNTGGTTFTGEVIITVSPSYSSYYFNDMAGYSSAQLAAVDFLYDHSITHGLAAGQYGPENPIRRGDFALMLYQAFEFYPISNGGSFSDVSPDAYYATAVNTLYARGVVSGTGGGYYAPGSTLTRQDAVCMVQRAMQAIGWNAGDGYASTLAGYGDSEGVSGYAQGAVAMAVQRGYLPTAGGWLNPQLPLTRVDMAELLHRVLTY